MKIVVLGLSITSSWGNGHTTTYRGLLREMAKRGHDIMFLERDARWYASHRDMPEPSFCSTVIYGSLQELFEEYTARSATRTASSSARTSTRGSRSATG